MECKQCNSTNMEKLGITIVELSDMQAVPAERWRCNDCGFKMTVVIEQ